MTSQPLNLPDVRPQEYYQKVLQLNFGLLILSNTVTVATTDFIHVFLLPYGSKNTLLSMPCNS